MTRILPTLLFCLALLGCAGPNGERPTLDQGASRTPGGSASGAFSGAYAGGSGALGINR